MENSDFFDLEKFRKNFDNYFSDKEYKNIIKIHEIESIIKKYFLDGTKFIKNIFEFNIDKELYLKTPISDESRYFYSSISKKDNVSIGEIKITEESFINPSNRKKQIWFKNLELKIDQPLKTRKNLTIPKLKIRIQFLAGYYQKRYPLHRLTRKDYEKGKIFYHKKDLSEIFPTEWFLKDRLYLY